MTEALSAKIAALIDSVPGDGAFWMSVRQGLLSLVDAIERLLMREGQFKGPRTADVRKQLKATRKERE